MAMAIDSQSSNDGEKKWQCELIMYIHFFISL